MFGMGWGGLIGRGFGEGSPERVPFANSDFIISSIGEELGLTGVIAVILLYGFIVERALRAALVCRDGFGKLMCVGLAGVLALQVFVVIGGVTRLIPLTGLTTPFLSAHFVSAEPRCACGSDGHEQYGGHGSQPEPFA